MNEGTLAIVVIIATIGVAIFAATHRELLFPSSDQHPRVTQKPLQGRRPELRVVRGGTSARRETRAKRAEAVSGAVSGIAKPQSDPEMIALLTIAKLVAHDLVTETKALETVFSVRAGSSKEYKRVQARFKIAQSELEHSPLVQQS